MYERPYAAYHEQAPVPQWFRHVPAVYSGPTLIVFPGTLTAKEQSEVRLWLISDASTRPEILLRCTQRAAIAKIAEFVAYYADPSYWSWKDADEASRVAQWRLFLADALIANKLTVPKSGEGTGVGSAEPVVPFTQGLNLA